LIGHEVEVTSCLGATDRATASSLGEVTAVPRDDDHSDEGATRSGADVVAFPTPGDRGATGERDAPLREVIGDVLREERRAQDRTLADVAAGAFVSLPYLSEVERGLKEPSSEVVASICAALDLPLADVLERSVDRLRAGSQRPGRIQLLAA
jgi:hypothetical protein